MLKTLRKHRWPYLFICPYFILFLLFQLIPVIWTGFISFTEWDGPPGTQNGRTRQL